MASQIIPIGNNKIAKEKQIGKPYSRGNTKAMLSSVAGGESKKGIEKLVDEIESDEQFFLGYLTLKSLVESAKVSIEVEGDSRAQTLADNLMAKFKEALPHACRAIGFGRAAFEKWYAGYDAETGQNHIGGLEPLPYSLTSMVVAGGEYYGCELKVKITAENGNNEVVVETIPARGSWWFALDPTPEQPQGKSRYLGAPEKVLERRQKLNDSWEIFGGRAANGLTVAKAPTEYPTSGITTKGDVGEVNVYGEPENPITDLVNSLTMAEDGGIVGVSSAVDPEKGTPLFEVLTQPVQSSADPLKALQSKEDDAALKSLGIPPKALDNNTGVGSYAQAETFMKPLLSTVEGILSQIVSSYQKQVVDDATAVNFGKSAKLTMVWQPLSEDRTAFVLEIVKGIVASPALSPLVAYQALDLGKLFEISGLPTGQDFAGAMAKIVEEAGKAAAAAGLPTPGGFGGGGGSYRASLITDARDALEVEGQPDVFSQSQIAKDLAAKIRERLPELVATIGDDQERGRL